MALGHLLQLLLAQLVGALLCLQQGSQLLLLLAQDVLLELALLSLGRARLLLPDGLVPPCQLLRLGSEACALGLEFPLQACAVLLTLTPQSRLERQ